MKIVDCFMFFNELNLLKYHLEVLYDHVDYFVFTEARQTHMGRPKLLNFEQNKHLFTKYLDKIIYVPIDLPFLEPCNVENREQWKNEKFQRDSIIHGLNYLKLEPTDIFILGDLDEITNPNVLDSIRKIDTSRIAFNLECDMYFHNLNTKCTDRWFFPKFINWSLFNELKISLDDLRWAYYIMPYMNDGGWHLSNFGDAQLIRNKLENYSHQEHNYEECKNLSTIQAKINAGISVFLKEGEKQNTIQLSIKDNPRLPPRLDLLQEFIKF